MKKSFLFLTMVTIIIGFSLPVNAVIVYNPNNGHYYERIDTQVNWIAAKVMAENMDYMGIQGHLATITSEEENWWIVENLGEEKTLHHWLGGYQKVEWDDEAEEFIDLGWYWVTGEPWDYTNWWTIPTVTAYNALEFDDQEGSSPVLGYWTRHHMLSEEEGYIVEYSHPIPEPSTFVLFLSCLMGIG